VVLFIISFLSVKIVRMILFRWSYVDLNHCKFEIAGIFASYSNSVLF